LTPQFAAVALTLLTSLIMHADLLHLGGNMLFFWIFGNNVEDRLGHALFVAFYLGGGIAAGLCHWATTFAPADTAPVIGASGAVAVMMGAYLVTFPRANVRVLLLLGWLPLLLTVPAVYVLVVWLLFDVLTLFLVQHGYVSHVALAAHIGGFAVGALVMLLLNRVVPAPPPDIEILEPTPAPPPPPPDPTGIYWDE
ncbi:MAG: rhomboid family intramembrane serine protease, partial [Planctomycetales bacterium]|nr:rhomboid family intramembrane serine protease [Planctomycetales bacterium]